MAGYVNAVPAFVCFGLPAREASSFMFVCWGTYYVHVLQRCEFATCLVRVWLASAFIIRNSDTYKQLSYIIYRVSILWGEKAGGRKWDDQMGEWSGACGCPENGMWVDGGKAWPGIRAWMNVRVECGSHGNGEMEMGSKMEQFHWLFNCTYLQTQYPSPCWKRSR